MGTDSAEGAEAAAAQVQPEAEGGRGVEAAQAELREDSAAEVAADAPEETGAEPAAPPSGGNGGEAGEADTAEEDAGDEGLGELPRTNVRRIVKAKLLALLGAKRKRAGEGAGAGTGPAEESAEAPRDIQMSRDALVAFSESAKIFVHYVTALARDWCAQSKRQTITAEDVLRGIEDAQFFEFMEPLQDTLQALRSAKKTKRKHAPSGEGTKLDAAKDTGDARQEGEETTAL